MDDALQFLHEFIIFQHLLVDQLQFFHLQAGQLFREMLLQVFLVFPESHDIVIMENNIGQLRIEFIFVEILVDFLEVGEQGVFFQLKVDTAFGEPGFG